MFDDVDVIIPWQEGCVYRELNLGWVREAWWSLGMSQIVGEIEVDRPWCKAEAVRAAIDSSTASTLVITDADVWSLSWGEAIERVQSGEVPYAMPHSHIHRLDPAATSRLLGHDSPMDFAGKLVQPPYRAVLGGGAVVITREAYERCPLDPRFVGWGQEDESWGIALRSMIGRGGETRNSPLYHLWHPPQERQNRRVGSDESRRLRDRYIAAARKPGAMEALIADVVFAP